MLFNANEKIRRMGLVAVVRDPVIASSMDLKLGFGGGSCCNCGPRYEEALDFAQISPCVQLVDLCCTKYMHHTNNYESIKVEVKLDLVMAHEHDI
jgi:hypothetical protein